MPTSNIDMSLESRCLTKVNNTLVLTPDRDYKVVIDVKEDLQFIVLQQQQLSGEIIVNFNTSNSSASVKLLQMSEHNEKNSLQITLNHQCPNTSSEVIARGVAKDSSKLLFVGQINIDKKAHTTQAMLESKNILTNKKAYISAKPILEINNSEVMCKHGATIGFIDLEALFYCQSRGLSYKEAKNLLLESFIAPITRAIHV